MEKAQEESIIDETCVDGEGNESDPLDLGVPDPQALDGATNNADSEEEDGGDGEDDDARSMRSSKSKWSVDAECEKESALEALLQFIIYGLGISMVIRFMPATFKHIQTHPL